jgi:predicted small secreted protein
MEHMAKPSMMRRFVGRAILLLATSALLAACSSSHNAGKPSNSGTTTSTSSLPPTTTAPTVATTGPLNVSATVVVPVPANVQIAAAEAPDGAVFVSPQSHDTATTTVVWVVDPTGPAEIAEHVNGGVSALAADATNLYVVADDSVIGYTRSTGNQMGQWKLPAIETANTSDANLVSMIAASGQVLVMITQGNEQDIYRINPTSTAAPKQIAEGTSAAFGPDGSVYYERSDNRLVKLSSSGVTTVGPALANSPNGEGGGIAGINAVAGGLIWVSEPAGQGLDAQLSPYNADTLQAMGNYSGSVTERIVDTSAGALVLVGANGPGGCPQGPTAAAISCVFRISQTAQLSYPTPVGTADQLLGPSPAVVTASTTTAGLVVDRLS